MVKSDLEQVKSEAKVFLYLTPVRHDCAPVFVAHPFFETCLIIDDETNELVDILENEEAMDKSRKQFIQKIEEAQDLLDIERMIRKPYKMVFLDHIAGYLTPADMGRYLASCFTGLYCVGADVNVSKKQVVKILKRCDPKTLMTESERSRLSRLNDTVVIYRGVNRFNIKEVKSLCWTLDPTYAEHFATRFGEEGIVYRAYIKKEDILAYFNVGEKLSPLVTIVVDPSKIIDAQVHKAIKSKGTFKKIGD